MRRTYLALVVLCAGVLAIAGGVTAQGSPQDRALDFVADTYGLSRSDLSIDYEETSLVPGLGEVTRFKVSSTSGGAFGAVLDAAGKVWTEEEFRVAADQAHLEEFGKVEVQLARRFEQDPAALIPVAIWLVVDDSLFAGLGGPDYVGSGHALNSGPGPELDAPEGDRSVPSAGAPATTLDEAGYEAARQALDDAVAAVQAAVAARLAEKGIIVEVVPRTPLLMATLGRAQVETAGQDPEVGWIAANDIDIMDMKGK